MAQEDHTGPYQPFYGTAAANKARRPIGGGRVMPFVAPVPTAAALPMEVSALHGDQPFTSFECSGRTAPPAR